MFLKLITHENKTIYLNVNEIKKFEKCEHDSNLTAIDLQYGTTLVKQRPEEIMEMLKGEK